MSKVAFLASFLATFMTMDTYFFDGSTTRFMWREIGDAANTAEAKIIRWTRPITHR